MIKESLSSITLNITSRCNYNCEYCTTCDKEDLLELEDIKKVLDDSVALKTNFLVISGGEPTLRKDYKEIIDYADENGLFVILFTNGSNIHEEELDYLKENVNIVRFTLDSSDEMKYDAIKGRGEFKKLINLIKLFRERNIAVNLNIPIGPHNVDEIFDIIKLALEKGVQTLRFAPIIPDSDEELYKRTLKNILDCIIKFKSNILFPDFKPVKDREEFIRNVEKLNCPGGVIAANINSDGGYTICAFDDNVLGNVIGNGIKELWFKHYDEHLNKRCKVINYDIGKILREVLDDKMWSYTAVRRAVSFWYTEIAGKEKMCFRGFPFWQIYLYQ